MRIFSDIGKRPTQQDRALVLERGEDFLMAIADGHGNSGDLAAEFAIKALEKYGIPKKPENALVDIKTAFDYAVEQTKMFNRSGSTLSAIYGIGERIFILQLGDSPIFIRQNGKFNICKTVVWRGHNVDLDQKDFDRAIAAGGKVAHIGTAVYLEHQQNCLKLTRSLGDNCFGEIVSKEPLLLELDKPAGCVCVCSDGFTFTNEEFKGLTDQKSGVERFVELQQEKKVSDNYSIILKYL